MDIEVTIRIYDDHRASADHDDGGYPTLDLCDDCAEELGTNVSVIDTSNAGEARYCAGCGSPNRVEEAQ